ncbi:MAG: single-stranded DNA-binding protein [Phycisphaerales bacterium]
MANLNKVMLMGNLTRDIELKVLPQGNQTVGNFGIAMNRKFKSTSGEEREEVTFVDCEAWGRTAEIMKQYLSKGRPVFIEGRLKLDQWEDKEGKKQSRLRVVVENFQFIGAPAGAGGGNGGGGNGGGYSKGATQTPSESHSTVPDSDIPF